MSPPSRTPDSSLSVIYMDHANSNSNNNGKSAEEDVVEEWLLMEECWSEAEGEVLEGCGVRFIEDPYSSLVVFQSSSSYITINGNEESCGSSFSDCGTSLMATLHSTTPVFTTPMDHHPFLSINDDDDDDDDDEVLPTLLGLRDHHREDLLLPN